MGLESLQRRQCWLLCPRGQNCGPKAEGQGRASHARLLLRDGARAQETSLLAAPQPGGTQQCQQPVLLLGTGKDILEAASQHQRGTGQLQRSPPPAPGGASAPVPLSLPCTAWTRHSVEPNSALTCARRLPAAGEKLEGLLRLGDSVLRGFEHCSQNLCGPRNAQASCSTGRERDKQLGTGWGEKGATRPGGKNSFRKEGKLKKGGKT